MLEMSWKRFGTASICLIPAQLWLICYLVPLEVIVAPWLPGNPFSIQTSFPGIGIPNINIRRSWHRLIFIMRIFVLVRRYIYIETASRHLWLESIHWSLLSSLIKQTFAEQFKQVSTWFTLSRFVRLLPRFIMTQTKHWDMYEEQHTALQSTTRKNCWLAIFHVIFAFTSGRILVEFLTALNVPESEYPCNNPCTHAIMHQNRVGMNPMLLAPAPLRHNSGNLCMTCFQMCHYIKPSVPGICDASHMVSRCGMNYCISWRRHWLLSEICDASHMVSRCWMNYCISWRRHWLVSLYVHIWVVDNLIIFEYLNPIHSMHVSPRCGLNLAVTSLTFGDKNE